MTHGTGLEVSGSPKGSASLPNIICPASLITMWTFLFLGEKNVSTFPDKRGLIHTSMWGHIRPWQRKHLYLEFLKV